MFRKSASGVMAAVALILLLGLPVVAPRTQPQAQAASNYVRYYIVLVSPRGVKQYHGPYYMGPYRYAQARNVANYINSLPIQNGRYGWRFYYIAAVV